MEKVKKQFPLFTLGDRIYAIYCTLELPFKELYYGIRRGAFPLNKVLGAILFLQWFLYLRLDFLLLRVFWWNALWLYPSNYIVYYTYYASVATLPISFWVVREISVKRNFAKRLTRAFRKIGFQNSIGGLPTFVSDLPIDENVRRLRLGKNGISLEKFKSQKQEIGEELSFFIDDVLENRAYGTVDLIYSVYEIDEEVRIDDKIRTVAPCHFIVGQARSRRLVYGNLYDTPHLLVGGTTNMGKSTWIRQLLTTLYLNNWAMEFTLIDLKGGLESDVFENLPRVKTVNSVQAAVGLLKGTEKILEERMKLLKENNCKDIIQYQKLQPSERKTKDRYDGKLRRHIIVVDEVAELSLSGDGVSSADAMAGRRTLSRIARQGRAVGIHLLVSTQRPDARALDTQIKANLSGVLCFQTVDMHSSLIILGNGRATELPPLKGRAIWKTGNEMVEVQGPLLRDTDAKELLQHFRSAPQVAPVQEGKSDPLEDGSDDGN